MRLERGGIAYIVYLCFPQLGLGTTWRIARSASCGVGRRTAVRSCPLPPITVLWSGRCFRGLCLLPENRENRIGRSLHDTRHTSASQYESLETKYCQKTEIFLGLRADSLESKTLQQTIPPTNSSSLPSPSPTNDSSNKQCPPTFSFSLFCILFCTR